MNLNSNIPEFMKGIRVMLVERVGMPGKLGVAVSGGKLVCPLPDGYDGQTRVNLDEAGWVLIAHPKMPPLLADPSTGLVHPITQDINQQHITMPKLMH